MKPVPPDLVQEISSPQSRVTGRIRHLWVTYDPVTGARKQVHQDPSFPLKGGKKLTWLPCYTIPAAHFDALLNKALTQGLTGTR
jgi:hypothetical protein